MLVKAPSVRKGNGSGLCQELAAGSKALGVVKTVARNPAGTARLPSGGAGEAGVTAGMRGCETRRETFHLRFAAALATTEVSGRAPDASPAEPGPDCALMRVKYCRPSPLRHPLPARPEAEGLRQRVPRLLPAPRSSSGFRGAELGGRAGSARAGPGRRPLQPVDLLPSAVSRSKPHRRRQPAPRTGLPAPASSRSLPAAAGAALRGGIFSVKEEISAPQEPRAPPRSPC